MIVISYTNILQTPKGKNSSNFNHHKNTSMANQVYDGANKDDGKSVNGGKFSSKCIVAKPVCLKFLHIVGSSIAAQCTISSSPKLFYVKIKIFHCLQIIATRRMIGFGKQRDGLYYLEASPQNIHSSPKNAYSPLLEIPTPPSPSSSIKTLLLTTSSLHSSPSLLLSSSNPSNPSPTLLRPPQSTPTETLCRSSRSHNPPVKLQDYVCSHITHACSDQSLSLLSSHKNREIILKSSSIRMAGCDVVQITCLSGQWYLESHISSDGKTLIVCCLLAWHLSRWSLHQLDVNNAFLHDDHHEEIYMSPPLGLQRQEEENLLTTDYSLFTRIQGKSFTTLLIYVNDILITRNDSVSISIIKKFLHSQFRHKDLGDLKYFLGIEVSSSKNGIFIFQRKYALEIIKNAGLLGVTPIDTPMKQGLKFFDKSDLLKDPGHYRRLVGILIYLTISRLHVVRYLKNALGQGLFFSSNNDFRLRAYCDSNWVGCPITRRLTMLLVSSLALITKTEYHAMTVGPHIEMDCHYIQDKIQDGSIAIRFLGKEVFTPMIRKLGVQDIHSPT
ncbi:hypothetical protein AAG906_021527 [Vitis piasezkii]